MDAIFLNDLLDAVEPAVIDLRLDLRGAEPLPENASFSRNSLIQSDVGIARWKRGCILQALQKPSDELRSAERRQGSKRITSQAQRRSRRQFRSHTS